MANLRNNLVKWWKVLFCAEPIEGLRPRLFQYFLKHPRAAKPIAAKRMPILNACIFVLRFMRYVVVPVLLLATLAMVGLTGYVALSGHTTGWNHPVRAMQPIERCLAFGMCMVELFMASACIRLIKNIGKAIDRIINLRDRPPPPPWPPGDSGSNRPPRRPSGGPVGRQRAAPPPEELVAREFH
ncbi:MAG TPA: hypothetical protein VK737_11110 [Opitutales bacterium]|jgi:hypothetical protein|nr:hypothetical protein [Opitutales bacterium]